MASQIFSSAHLGRRQGFRKLRPQPSLTAGDVRHRGSSRQLRVAVDDGLDAAAVLVPGDVERIVDLTSPPPPRTQGPRRQTRQQRREKGGSRGPGYDGLNGVVS